MADAHTPDAPMHMFQYPDIGPGTEALVTHITDRLLARGRRLRDNEVYEELRAFHADPILPRSHGTHVWAHAMSLEDFVVTSVHRHTHYALWRILTEKAGTIARVADLVARGHGCPGLVWHPPQSHVTAWANGLYNGLTDTFWAYGDPSLPAEWTAASFHDSPFPHGAFLAQGWRAVPVPPLDGLIAHHGLGGSRDGELAISSSDAIYGLLGRLQYEGGSRDTWGVTPYVVGMGPTGKSTLTHMATASFAPGSIGHLAGTMDERESVFARSRLHAKAMVVVGDMTERGQPFTAQVFEDFLFPRSIPVMCKPALEGPPPLPAIATGDRLPPWSADDIIRLLVPIPFTRHLAMEDMDHTIIDRFRTEDLAAYVYRSNRAYAHLLAVAGPRDLRPALPHELRSL